MVSKVLSTVCLLCVVLLPVVWANYCKGFWNTDGDYIETLQCGWDHCCGSCYTRYCCDDNDYLLTEEQQDLCPERNGAIAKLTSKSVGTVIGAVVGCSVLVLLILVILCCVVPCCLCYKWRKRRQQNVVNTTTVIHVPPSVSPAQPSYPDYQPVPLQPQSTMSFPSAPPSYLEATDPSCSPPPLDYGQMPPYPIYPQPTDERIQLPYNPAYCPNP